MVNAQCDQSLKELNLCFNIMNVKLCLLNQEPEFLFYYYYIKSPLLNLIVKYYPLLSVLFEIILLITTG